MAGWLESCPLEKKQWAFATGVLCPHLFEADDVWVAQRAVVDDFSLHVLVNLHRRQDVWPK